MAWVLPTIREHLQRTYRFAIFVLVAGLVLIALSSWIYPAANERAGYIRLGLLVVALFVVVALAFRGRFNCPRCGTKLKAHFSGAEAARSTDGDKCPKCGVSLNDVWAQ